MAKSKTPPTQPQEAPPLRLEYRSPQELAENPKNWRRHPQEQLGALRGQLSEVGWAGACLYNERTGRLIDGHARRKVALEQGAATVPVLVGSWDEATEAKILATLDPLGGMATADPAALDALLREVNTGCAELQQMLDDLWSEAEADALANTEPAGEVEEDTPPEPQAAVVTRPGDVWILGRHRLLCGDSRKAEDVTRLLAGVKVNVCFTSPPYASQRKYDESSGFKPIPPDEYVAWWEPLQANVKDNLAGDGSFFVNIKPACEGLERELYVFDLVVTMRREWGWLFAEEFCWQRTGIPQQVVRRFKNQFEPVYQFSLGEWKIRPEAVRHASDSVPIAQGPGAGDTNAARRQGTQSAVEGNEVAPGMAYPGNRLPVFSESHEALGHGAAFPVGLPAFFIRAFSDEGDAILDPFMGSGTTIIACEQLNRRGFGIEISPGYCDIIVRRWQSKANQHATRESDGARFDDLQPQEAK